MTARPVIFLPDPWTWEGWMFDRLRAAGCELRLGPSADDPTARPLSPDAMRTALRDVDALLLHSREAVPAAAIADASRLLVISKMGIGVEKIDVPAATAAGVLVTNTPVAENYQGIAEGTIALLLAVLKRLGDKERQLRGGGWRDRSTEGELLAGRTVGIVGLGRVGSAVAAMLGGWDVRRLGADPRVGDDRARALGVEPVSFERLLEESDIVTLHAALPVGSPPLMDADAFARMRPGAYLVNTARGLLVDEAALVDAIRTGHLAGAALDVFAQEPLPPDSPLRELPSVVLTPHSIGTSRASQRAICETAVENGLAALAGRVPPHVVNPEAVPAWRGRLRGASLAHEAPA